MRKPTEGKVALLSFLEAVEDDIKSKKDLSNAEKLAKHMKEQSEDDELPTGKSKCDGSEKKEYAFAKSRADLKGKTDSITGKKEPVAEEDEEGQMDEASFSRQHYQAIADILKGAVKGEAGETEVISEIANKLVELFRQDNPRFDATKFLSAAGVGE